MLLSKKSSKMTPRENYTKERTEHWKKIATKISTWKEFGNYYHSKVNNIYQFLIPHDKKVLELGCSEGDLLASTFPAYGVGIDFSEEMVNLAKEKYPNLNFIVSDVHEIKIDEKFDYIILSDLVNDLWDVQETLEQVYKVCHPNTKIIINSYSKLWSGILNLSSKLKLSKPTLVQNWLAVEDIENLLEITNFQSLRVWSEFLFPFKVPILSSFINRYLAKIWPFYYFCLTNFIISRPVNLENPISETKVSVIVAARNEEGNIQDIFESMPLIGDKTELIFVEGNSQDNTFEKIQEMSKKYPLQDTKLFKQTGKGKGDAVRLGFEAATGDVLMILDADLTVSPDDLIKFYKLINSNKAEFVNGVRLVYPMEKKAMRFFNLVGNKFFSLAFSWLLGQSIKDTLCGTKVLSKKHYDEIAKNRNYFGDFDPFGDFDLIFGAAKLNLKIMDMPVRYKERIYGETNIQRWRHGLILLRMVIFAARKIKFF
jgi:ubiquinone/menaquinone biosynthesis C-methylase UbiE